MRKGGRVQEYIAALDVAGKAAAYMKIMSIPSDRSGGAVCVGTMASMTRADMEAAMIPKIVEQTGMDEASIAGYQLP